MSEKMTEKQYRVHEVAAGLPPELEGMTYWELEMMGVWLDGSYPYGREPAESKTYDLNDLLRMRDYHFTTMGEGELWNVAWEREVVFAPALNRFIASLPSDARSDDWARDFRVWIDENPGNLRRRTVTGDERQPFTEMAPSPFDT